MNSIIGTLWNCGGLRGPSAATDLKLDFYSKEMNKTQISLAIFVETHLKQTDPLPSFLQLIQTRYQIINEPTSPQETHAGVLVLVHKDLDIIKTLIIQQGRIICMYRNHSSCYQKTL